MGGLLQTSYQDLERRVAERTEELSQMASENARLYEEATASARAREDFFRSLPTNYGPHLLLSHCS